MKERLLREDKLTLNKAISVCRADEESKRQIQKMNEAEHGNVVHVVKKKTKSRGFTGGARPKEKTEYKFQCNKCGIIHERKSVLHMEKYVINVNYLIISPKCANQK